MRVAALYDVHGNLPALEAVLAEVEREDVDEIVLTTDSRLEELLAGVEQGRVVAGHTHMQLERRVGDVLFVNAGSVGRPYEARAGAYCALLDEEVEFRRTEYDLEGAAERIRASGHPRAEELAAENVLQVPSRAEALAAFGG